MTTATVTAPSRSEFVRVRGLRHHVRRWGDPELPMLFLGHGWLDVSATFHYLVQPLLTRWQVLAPDWRGLGHTQWPTDGYWFQDYVADLDAIIAHYAGKTPIALVGHSMGGQIMSLYAGLRAERVSHLVCLDSLFLPDTPVEQTAHRFRRWLDQLPRTRDEALYDSFDHLAQRIRVQHPRLPPGREAFVARCWGFADGHGHVRLLADPRHRAPMPTLFRLAESMTIWREVTAATLFLDAADSQFRLAISSDETAARRACFRKHRCRMIEDSGHMLHFDAAEATGIAIAAFLAGD